MLPEPDRAKAVSPTVYAMSAAFLSAFPVPFLNGTLSSLARGAAIRRVTEHHQVSMTRDARRVLAEPGFRRNPSTWTGKIARVALGRTFSAVNFAGRVEAGLSTYYATLLINSYLASDLRKANAPLEKLEAERIREAMERAFESVSLEALQALPSSSVHAAKNATREAWSESDLDRSAVERWVDTVLDELASAPHHTLERLSEVFFEAVRREHIAV